MRLTKWAAVLTGVVCTAGVTRGAFTPGDVIAKNNYGEVYDVTAGGTFGFTSKLATIGTADTGKVAFSADDSTMYVSNPNTGNIYVITSSGASSAFATGLINPKGLLRTSSGQLLVAESGPGRIIDITAGGNFSSQTAFASNMSAVDDLAQTSDGRLFAATLNGTIYNMTGGGAMNAGNVFASTSFGVDNLIAAPGGGLLAANPNSEAVFAISGTGGASVFASGLPFNSVAYAPDGKLLAVASNATGNVYDISAGGNIVSPPVLATVSDDALNNLTSVPAIVPEPGTVCVLVFGALANAMARRRW